MRRFIPPVILFCMFSAVMACVAPPERQDVFASRKVRESSSHKSSAYKDINLALVSSENTINAIKHLRNMAQRYTGAGYDQVKPFDSTVSILKSNFKTVLKVDSVDDPKASNVDLVAILDMFVVIPQGPWDGNYVTVEIKTILLSLDEKEIDRIEVKGSGSIWMHFKPKNTLEEATNNALTKLELALSSSEKLMAFSKQVARRPKVASRVSFETKSQLKVPPSDIDNPSFNSSAKIMGDKDIAIVIGVEKYQDLPSSDYSYGDAVLVKDYLTALGFRERNISLVLNERATRSSIKKTIETWLPNRVKKDSRVVVYYSGHGAPEPKSGEIYLVPYDGDANYLEDTGYPMKRLYAKLGALNVKEVMVVLDSCFSGAGGRSVLAKGARPLVVKVKGAKLNQNMAVLSATSGMQISSSSPEKGHGILTYYFLKALKEGKKGLAEIYEYIKPKVEDEAKLLNIEQSPNLNPPARILKGKFRLLR